MSSAISVNKDFCGIILAGGKSRRMGTDKSELIFNGKSFLEIQIDKMTELSISDIIISGKSCAKQNVHTVMDIIPDCGPLGGLYSCFSETDKKYALVFSIDVPLISVSTLKTLTDKHLGSDYQATVLTCNGQAEPLIAVYNTDTTNILKELIEIKKLAIKSFLEKLDCQFVAFSGNTNELLNCNYPDDYKKLSAILP